MHRSLVVAEVLQEPLLFCQHIMKMVSLCSFREFGIHTTAYAPVSIRSEMSKHFGEKIKSKDDAFDFVKNNIENF